VLDRGFYSKQSGMRRRRRQRDGGGGGGREGKKEKNRRSRGKRKEGRGVWPGKKSFLYNYSTREDCSVLV
jgi:hypothetical protein